MAAAEVYSGLDYIDDALALYLRASQLEPQSASIHYNIGLIHIKQKHFAQAIDPLKKALALDPSLNEARLLLATAYEALGERPKAIESLAGGIKLTLKSSELHTRLGELYLAQGRIPEAEKEFSAVLALKNDDIP